MRLLNFNLQSQIIVFFSTAQKQFIYWRFASLACSALVLLPTLISKAEHLTIKTYTVADGLPQNSINKITQEATGFVWFCTDGGLARFDGYTFTNFTVGEGLLNDRFKDFLTDRDGNYWLATFGGLDALVKTVWDGCVRLCPHPLTIFGAGKNQTSFQAHSGEWWIANGRGVFRYPKVDFDKLPTTPPITVLDKKSGLAPQDIFRLYEDSCGDVWISTSDETGRGFYRWQRNTETLIDVGNIEELPTKDKDTIRSFAEDRAGNLWISFSTRGFARISSDKARFFDLADGVPQGGGISMFVDREGRLWAASGSEGVARIDEPASENPRIVKIGKNEGLSTNRTFAVTQDLQGLIYIATDRDINRLNPATGRIKILKISGNQPQREFRSAFCGAKGILWFGVCEV